MEGRTGMGEVKLLRSKVAALEQLLEVTESVVREQSAKVELALEKFRGLLECAPDGIIIFNGVGRIVLVNSQVDKLFGYRREDLIGQPIETLLSERFLLAHEAHRRRHAAMPEAPPMENGTDFYGLRRDGSAVPIEISLSPFKDEDGELVLAAVRDITVRRQIEEELRCARQLAEAANAAKSNFLANMSHEIRTPMNGVIGMTQLLLETPLTKEQGEYVETIRSSGETLLVIINDILDFSKIEAGKLELERVPFHLPRLIGESLEPFAQPGRRKGIEFTYLVSPEIIPSLLGDPMRLRQVLTNLVSNAVKFTERGEVFVSVESVEATTETELVRVEVRDTGIGIAPAVVGQLFQPFTQGDGSTTRKFGGTGLGLAISKRLVEKMGGEIGVESEPGKGSTFWFTAQFRRDRETRALAHGPSARLEEVRALIVDDNETNRRVLRVHLTSRRIKAEEAASGPRALEILAQAAASGTPYQLVLLDVEMPVMDGLEVARRIRAESAWGRICVILVSSVGDLYAAETLETLGIAAQIHKPIQPERLFSCIVQVLSAAQPRVLGEATPTASVVGPAKQGGPSREGSGSRVLIVEDNAVNQRVVARMLEKLGCVGEVCGNGEEAIERVREVLYDLVLMDCQMPVLDGYDATRAIRQAEALSGSYVPIIAVTANAMAGDAERCLGAGMDGYLAKPIKFSELKVVVEKWGIPQGRS